MPGGLGSERGTGRRTVLLGAPGSGKGTQAERVAAALAVPAISTGDMLRQAVAEGSELGSRVKSVMAAGLLVDDGLMTEVVRERLGRSDACAGFVLDGFPRTISQAEALDTLLAACRHALDAVVLLEVPQEALVRRALGRKRDDDREEVIRQRLELYHEKTEPLVGHYAGRGLLVRVDGGRPIDDVTAAILSRLAPS
jgi:adenylate kinase